MKFIPILLLFCSTAFAQFGLRSSGFVAGPMVPPAAAPAAGVLNVSGTWTNRSSSGISESVTCPTGDNRLLVLSEFPLSAGGASAVTYNGVALNKFFFYYQAYWVGLWYLAAPAEGAHTLSITASNASYIVYHATFFTNANQVTPLIQATNNYNSWGNALSVTNTTSVGNVVLTHLGTQAGRASIAPPDSSMTLLNAQDCWGVAFTNATTTTTITGWTWSADYAALIVSVVVQ